MKFDPNEYETVKSRKERFYKDHVDGRITVKLLTTDHIMDYAVFEARVYLTAEDQKNDCPRGVGYATEVRDKELSTSNSGSKYESVNYSSWTENSEESSVGRALDNAGYSGNKKPSREEMVKASTMNQTLSKPVNQPTNLGNCPRCGAPNKWSTLKQKAYCGAMCWNNAPKVPDKIQEEVINYDQVAEMPF